MEIETKFRIKNNAFRNFTFEVTAICPDGDYRCIDQKGDVHFFSDTNFKAHGDAVQILNRPKYQTSTLKDAVAQVLNLAMLNDEGTASQKWNAIWKAETEIKENDSIQFDGKVLSFVSRASNEKRFVTKDGCSNLCKCKCAISYHWAIFEILITYQQMQGANVKAFRPKVRREVVRLAA